VSIVLFGDSMLFNYLFIFMIGSILGCFFELIYRKAVFNKWIKPGVFTLCYLPLYGIGLCISYFIYNLDVNIIFKVILAMILLTFIEFVCGLIFIKYFRIPLWDYNDKFLNYKGLICFKFSVYWGILAFIFISFIFPFINFELFNNKFIIYFMYFFYMVLLCYFLYKLVIFFF